MHLCKLTIILSWLIAGFSLSVSAQLLDSLLLNRQNNLQEYTQFKNNMTERTWINLIELNELAGRVINTDNELIWNHLVEEMARNKEIIAKNDRVALEVAFLRKETEQAKNQLNEHQTLNTMFMMIILGLSVALIILIIALITLYRRNKETFQELRRLWSMNDEHSLILREKEQMLNKQLRLLEIENMAMQNEMAQLARQKSQAKQQQEKSSIEETKNNNQIRNLRDQIKKKSG